MLARVKRAVKRVLGLGPSAATLTRRQVGQWSKLGREAPFWSVLSGCARAPEVAPAEAAEFFASGAGEIDQMEEFFRAAGCEAPRQGLCVDWGCGLGRVTLHLARRFDRAVGVDISAEHLQRARANMERVDAQAARKIDFLCLAHQQREIRRLRGQVALVHCILVLQHIPPPLMIRALRTFTRLLRPGGFAFFQIPTSGQGYDPKRFEYDSSRDFDMHALPETVIDAIFREGGCTRVARFEKDRTGPGFVSHYFIYRRDRSPSLAGRIRAALSSP